MMSHSVNIIRAVARPSLPCLLTTTNPVSNAPLRPIARLHPSLTSTTRPRSNLRAMATSAPNGASSSSGSGSSSSAYKPVITLDSINPNVRNVEYAVRGELSNLANKYADDLAAGRGKELKFDSVVSANIGNPQQMPYLAQKPLTFWRQVAALTEYPALMDVPGVSDAFPEDVQKRAKSLLGDVGSVGAYSHSKGAASIRKHVAQFIEARDGYPSDPELIYLTSGASQGVQLLMTVLISDPSVGMMIPIPQYPLYSAALSLYNAHPVRYDLDPSKDWAVDVPTMAKNCDEARAKGVDVRALVVINPGNPTGSCLTEDNIRDIIRLAHEKRLVVFADEVYQANIYQPESRPFISFKKVLKDFSKSSDAKERSIADDVELVSFHSISKGVSGECGRRGGYFELTNIREDVQGEIYKMASVNLCSSLQGQIGVDLLVKPPVQGEPSYALWKEETDAIHATLKSRSQKMRKQFQALDGVECGEPQGALYLFPSIKLPQKALRAAQEAKRVPDLFYCLKLLDRSGICVVPGSGFGKMPEDDGTVYLRTTTLAKETDAFVKRFADFHQEFMKEYA